MLWLPHAQFIQLQPHFAVLLPSCTQIPFVGALVDTYSLWLSSRNAFLAWALLGCRPPLHIALPMQLFGLWRITAAGFCAAPVLQHPVMVERTGKQSADVASAACC